ncbi:MAG: hypothetical protein AAGC74_10935, partial [Verrucomicrobiota bacterium]
PPPARPRPPPPLEVPVGFWHGEADRNIPFGMVKRYVDWVPTAERHFFAGEGHYSLALRKAPEVVERVALAGKERVEERFLSAI